MQTFIKKTVLTFALLIAFAEAFSQKEDERINMLKDFYKCYIGEIAKMPMDFEKINAIKVKFGTSNLIKTLEQADLDYDPFINAQDLASDLNDKLVFQKEIGSNDIFEVSYTDGYSKEKIIIRLKVVEVNGAYKIDSIL